jgi:hypothetical protein
MSESHFFMTSEFDYHVIIFDNVLMDLVCFPVTVETAICDKIHENQTGQCLPCINKTSFIQQALFHLTRCDNNQTNASMDQ